MKLVALMSGGIDSPTAVHLALSKGAEVMVLNMDNSPLCGSDELEKVEELARKLFELHPGRIRLFRAPHGINLLAFKERSERRYTCILCKKAMLALADRLCDKWGADGILMGDSMGQVASQTLKNMAAVSRGVKHPIIRPLIGLDKVDIERMAKSAGTFDISIKRTMGCQAAPKHPIVSAVSERLEEEASRVGLPELLRRVEEGVVEVDLKR